MEKLMSVEEKTKLVNELESQVGEIELARSALEAEFEKAKTSGDFSRFQELEKTAKSGIFKAEKIQRKLEGRDEALEISATYSYSDEGGKKIEQLIELSFETELARNQTSYEKNGLVVPDNFAETMRDIWTRNTEAIQEAIREKGFDRVILIPETFDSADLKKFEEVLTRGYKEEATKAGKTTTYDTYWGEEASTVANLRTGDRLILIHSAPDLMAQPELKKTLNKKYGGEKTQGQDNKAEDFIKEGEQLTLPEWLILQRQIWEETGEHIDGKVGEDGFVKPTWCPGSRVGTGTGASVLCALWDPALARVAVHALSPGVARPDIGCRLSRCFK